jgi:hypothetical protein
MQQDMRTMFSGDAETGHTSATQDTGARLTTHIDVLIAVADDQIIRLLSIRIDQIE